MKRDKVPQGGPSAPASGPVLVLSSHSFSRTLGSVTSWPGPFTVPRLITTRPRRWNAAPSGAWGPLKASSNTRDLEVETDLWAWRA